MTAADWRERHRSASPAYGLMLVVALIAKHRHLKDGRLARFRLEATDRLEVWTETAQPDEAIEVLRLEMPQARVVGVRTHMQDDEIVGYVIVLEIPGLRLGQAALPLPTVMKVAFHYWDVFLTPQSGECPPDPKGEDEARATVAPSSPGEAHLPVR